MTIKPELIGATIFKKGIGTYTIELGKEKLYKKLGLDIFELEPVKNDTNQGPGNRKRKRNADGKSNSE